MAYQPIHKNIYHPHSQKRHKAWMDSKTLFHPDSHDQFNLIYNT